MIRRKTLFYSLAAVVGISGVAISQWVMTHFRPSTELAVAFPAMLIGSGLIAGLLACIADYGNAELPRPSNDTDPRPGKARVKIRRGARSDRA